jgi:hypothetical protein
MAFCRESFLNAEGVIAHLQNIEALFKEGLCKYGELVSLQIHGPKEELDKLRRHAMIEEMCPEFYELMPGSFEVIELPIQQTAEVKSSSRVEPSGSCTPIGSARQKAKVLNGGLSSDGNVMHERSTTSIRQDSHVSLTQTPTTYMAPPFNRP